MRPTHFGATQEKAMKRVLPREVVKIIQHYISSRELEYIGYKYVMRQFKRRARHRSPCSFLTNSWWIHNSFVEGRERAKVVPLRFFIWLLINLNLEARKFARDWRLKSSTRKKSFQFNLVIEGDSSFTLQRLKYLYVLGPMSEIIPVVFYS